MTARSLVLRVLGILLLFVAAGSVGGVLWTWLWTPPEGVVQEGTWQPTRESFSAVADGTVLFALVAAGLGIVCGGLVSLVPRRELLTLVLVLLGSAAAVAIMYGVGTLSAPPDPQLAAASVPDGTRLPATLRVDGWAPYLVLPTTALLTLSTCYLLAPERSRRHSAEAV